MEMKRMRVGRLAGLVLIVLLAGLPRTWAQSGMGDQEVLVRFESLSRQMGMPEDKAFRLKRHIERLFQDPDFNGMAERTPITGVMVYRTGEGGLVLKIVKGDGWVSFQERPNPQEVSVESWQVGAHVGGAVVWGAALVMGLRDPAYFGGEYVGQSTSATAADTSTSEQVLLRLADPPSETQAHNLMLVQAAVGLSANAGDFKLNIIPQ